MIKFIIAMLSLLVVLVAVLLLFIIENGYVAMSIFAGVISLAFALGWTLYKQFIKFFDDHHL